MACAATNGETFKAILYLVGGCRDGAIPRNLYAAIGHGRRCIDSEVGRRGTRWNAGNGHGVYHQHTRGTIGCRLSIIDIFDSQTIVVVGSTMGIECSAVGEPCLGAVEFADRDKGVGTSGIDSWD